MKTELQQQFQQQGHKENDPVDTSMDRRSFQRVIPVSEGYKGYRE
jgi:hypothetical protein